MTGRHPDTGAVLPRRSRPATDTGSGTGSSLFDGPPRAQVVVRVDLDALLRGQTEPRECCEIDDLGPIPVPMARDLANDSFLAVLFHRAGDIKAVSHFGRTINATLRTALVHRDRTCVVPNCGVSYGLEIDHLIPFAEGGPTSLDNLALLCHHHHFLKTYDGWQLERHGPTDEEPNWSFTPLPAFGQEPDLGLDLPGRRMGRGP
jgi:5-methylcytosine-specific restriction endonuclease McrA